MKRPVYLALTLLTGSVCVIAAVLWFTINRFMTVPPQTEAEAVHVVIAPGTSFGSIARQLKADGVITDTYKFQLLARYRQELHAVQAGEFLLQKNWTPDRVLETLVRGQSILHKLHFPEGLTWWQIADAIEKQGFAKAEDLATIFRDPAFLAKHHIPFSTAEGFLFPETYHLPKPRQMTQESARIVSDLLVSMFWRKATALWPQVAEQSYPEKQELQKIVILASLVEKETGAPHERRRIAGVYANRLRKKMLMQADPTIIYGLGTAFDGNITRKHLRDAENPYNTYRHRGLPPGPICSPGLEALRAALTPEEHNYLYFVSKKDGTHKFSKTLREHNNAVIKYQLKGRRPKK